MQYYGLERVYTKGYSQMGQSFGMREMNDGLYCRKAVRRYTDFKENNSMSNQNLTAELEEKYKNMEKTMWDAFDEGYANGLHPNLIKADIQDFVAGTETGRMDSTVEMIWLNWKNARGIA